MKKSRLVLMIFVFILILGGIGLFIKIKDRTIYNKNYVNGNSAGNLYNAGLFCEDSGTIFLPTRMTITGYIPWIPMETI